MPVNETGRVIIHKGLGNRIIQPGQDYPGRKVGPDGEYLEEEPAVQMEASAVGASSEIAKLPPAEWPDRASLSAMELPALKGWATVQEVKFHPNAGKDNVLDKIDAARAAATTTE